MRSPAALAAVSGASWTALSMAARAGESRARDCVGWAAAVWQSIKLQLQLRGLHWPPSPSPPNTIRDDSSAAGAERRLTGR